MPLSLFHIKKKKMKPKITATFHEIPYIHFFLSLLGFKIWGGTCWHSQSAILSVLLGFCTMFRSRNVPSKNPWQTVLPSQSWLAQLHLWLMAITQYLPPADPHCLSEALPDSLAGEQTLSAAWHLLDDTEFNQMLIIKTLQLGPNNTSVSV